MKVVKYLLSIGLVIGLIVACDTNYIDPIKKVNPGPDAESPEVSITYPTGDVIIPFTDTETDLDIEFEVTDDIEIQSITVSVDGDNVATYDDFLDYRRATRSYNYESLGLGDHTIQVSAKDMAGKTTIGELTFEVSNKYVPKYSGEIFYMPFEGDLNMDLVEETSATVVGATGFTTGKIGKGYLGTTDSYLTYPTDGLTNSSFSATMWYKLNAVPDRAGIMVMGPPDLVNPGTPNNRKNGFRFFRENGASGKQRFKLNVGDGAADTWFDGGAAADVDNGAGWVFLAFTISPTQCRVFINGNIVKEGTFTGVDWTGCDILSLASGAPRFTEWGHLSDLSVLDEVRIYNKALTQTEVQAVMNGN